MKSVVKLCRPELHLASLAIVFLLLIIITAGSIPQVYGYTFLKHPICKGWTEEGEPIVTDKFLLTDEKVYLYFEISWVDVQEYEQKWGEIPDIQRGIISAERMEESFEMKTFRISLTDPSRTKVNIPYPRTMHKVIFDPPGCVSSAFLEILVITDTTKNGRWKVSWYDGDELIFTEEFVVGEEKIVPMQTFLEKFGLWIAVILVVVVVAVGGVAIYIFRGKRKAAEASAVSVSPK